MLIIIPFEELTARERNILFQSQKRREEVSSWQKILQCNWSACFREVFREKSDFFIYNCGFGASLFTLSDAKRDIAWRARTLAVEGKGRDQTGSAEERRRRTPLLRLMHFLIRCTQEHRNAFFNTLHVRILYEPIFFKMNFSRFRISDNIFVIWLKKRRPMLRASLTVVARSPSIMKF